MVHTPIEWASEDVVVDVIKGFIADLSHADKNCASLTSLLQAHIQLIIADLDYVISHQLTEILQDSSFQNLEALWRGLWNLVGVPYQKSRVKIKCLDMGWDELSTDLNIASSIKRTQLYNKIINKELNTLGGEPFGAIVVDYSISLSDHGSSYDELYTLELLGSLGKQALCPFVLSVSDTFFGGKGAAWITDIKRIGKVLDSEDFADWKRLQKLEESRFVALTFPRLQLRKPYRHHKAGFIFNEAIERETALWGSAHFAFASTVIREFNRIGWFGFLKSRWHDKYQGAVMNIPNEINRYSEHPWILPQPDIRLFGNIARFYTQKGFIPLCHSPLTNKYYFLDNRSIWHFDEQEGVQTDDAVLTQIQTTLSGCRIAHFIKVKIRGMLGSLMNAKECESVLSHWLEDYVSNISSSDEEILARYPLRKASVSVHENPYDPGAFLCDITLQPQYQFDMFGGNIVLTTDLGRNF